jgi:CHAD domain-containing protein
MPGSPTRTDPTSALLQQRVRSFFQPLPKAFAGDEESVHDVRTMGRRLRGCLPLLAHKPRGRRVRRSLRGLRDLTRTAARSRDLDVMLELLEKRLDAIAATPETRLLRRRLRDARRRSHTSMGQALLDLDVAALRRDLRALVARGAEGLWTVLPRIQQAKNRVVADALDRWSTAGATFDPEALHQVRIDVRRLRYLAEIAGTLRKEERSAGLGVFKELQDRLGRLHDTAVLAAWLDRQATSAQRRGTPALAEEARRLADWFLDASRADHKALLEDDLPGAVRRGAEAIDAASRRGAA